MLQRQLAHCSRPDHQHHLVGESREYLLGERNRRAAHTDVSDADLGFRADLLSRCERTLKQRRERFATR